MSCDDLDDAAEQKAEEEQATAEKTAAALKAPTEPVAVLVAEE